MAFVKYKRSAVSGKVPTVADLNLGEFGINTFDGKLYMKKDDGTQSIIEIGAGGGGGGSGTVTSVAASGGTTGLTFSGSPITTSGTLTLGGTLAVTNGGTGATTASSARANLGAAASGANSDITSLSGITGGIGTADYVQFDTAGTGSSAVGQLAWNDTEGTLEFQAKGGNVTIQIGQEQTIRVTNQSGSDMTDGQVVYITGSTGNHLNVTLAQANSEATSSKTIAVITEAIANNNSGFATTDGLVHGLNTSALTEGAAIWLSPTVAGGMTTTKPAAPNHGVLIGWCVKQHATVGVIFVKISNGLEVDELHDVKITGTPAAGSLLIRNATTALWENATITQGAGITITNGDKSISIAKANPPISSTTSLSSPFNWNSDEYEQYGVTAQAANLSISADAGSPYDGKRMVFRFKDNGTARMLTWATGASKAFRAVGITLPTTTVIGKTLYVGCIYNSADSRWDAVAVAQEA